MYLHRTIMHKLLMAILLLGSINQVILAAGGWTPVSQAQSERDAIMSRFSRCAITIYKNRNNWQEWAGQAQVLFRMKRKDSTTKSLICSNASEHQLLIKSCKSFAQAVYYPKVISTKHNLVRRSSN